MFLSEKFLSSYPNMPEHMTELGSFVFYRTYSRWLPGKGRRETWKEAIIRAVEYNMSIAHEHYLKNKYIPPMQEMTKEAEMLFDNIFNLRQFLSGRTHWIGGTENKVANKFPLSNFNCAFLNITKYENLCELFYLLLVGTGVGFKCTPELAKKLPPIRDDFKLLHSEYNPLSPSERLEYTRIENLGNGYAKMYIGDSKEGWVQALNIFFAILTQEIYEDVHTIKISYNSIRPKGERLKTFGGTASGHKPMLEMFEGIEKVVKNTLDPDYYPMERIDDKYVKLRPIHILDIGNFIGYNVVVGGVRRTAEIFLFSPDDEETLHAKDKINDVDYLHHRRMSNNSEVFEEKPTRSKLHEIFKSIKIGGEPGFINLEAARKRRPNVEGVNPCGEILLDSHEVCNLTTVNTKAFLKNGKINYPDLYTTQELSARAALRMTLLDLELEEFDFTQKRDRLTGCSLTGWEDSQIKKEHKTTLEATATTAAQQYADELRIPAPLLVTTVKPEGTLSQVAGGVSPGVHNNYAPYYIRRIRINANDPLAQVAKELNWNISPEVGDDKYNPRTLVIDFPIESGCTTSSRDVTAKQQLESYFDWFDNYAQHNPSVTIYVKDDEWDEVEQIIWDNWDDFIGISFLPHNNGTYELAPYEEITKEEYISLKSKMKPFNPDLLLKYEHEEIDEAIALEGVEECASGACPIR